MPNTPRQRSLALAALIFGTSGLLHFAIPELYVRIVPSWLPNAPALVAVSGVAELLGAVGLLVTPARYAAGWGLIALLVAVFPANVQMLFDARADGDSVPWQAALLLRLPLQVVLVRWIWWIALRRAPLPARP